MPFTAAARPALRADEPVPSDLALALLAGSPDSDDGYFIVPEIQHQDL